MKPLIPQTVYVNNDAGDFEVHPYGNHSIFNGVEKKENQYILTKEELAKLLDDAYSAGVDWDIFDNTTPSKQEYINNLLNQQ